MIWMESVPWWTVGDQLTRGPMPWKFFVVFSAFRKASVLSFGPTRLSASTSGSAPMTCPLTL